MFDVKINTAAAKAFWSSHDLRQRKVMAFFMPKISVIIRNQLRSFLRSVERDGYPVAKANIRQTIELEPVVKVLKQMYLRGAYIESNYVLNYLLGGRKSAPVNMEQKRVRPRTASFGLSLDDLSGTIEDYFRIRVLNDSALPINESTRKYIKTYLLDKVDNGMPLDQAIAEFRELALTKTPNAYAAQRARRIALTETTKVMSFGGLIGAYMSGLDVEKVWVTSDDEKVRGLPNYQSPYSHVALDGVSEVLLGAFYNRENIKFPGDPDADIKNTVNCRCCLYYREKPKPRGQARRGGRVKRNLRQFLIDFLARTALAAVINNLTDEDGESL